MDLSQKWFNCYKISLILLCKALIVASLTLLWETQCYLEGGKMPGLLELDNLSAGELFSVNLLFVCGIVTL